MQTTPFFKDATPTATWVMRFFVGANIVVILFCTIYLVRHFAAAGLGWAAILATALAGYFLADFASGVVHWSMDTWFDERTLGRAIAIAREHHTHPHHIHGYSFLDRASLGSTPSVVCFGFMALVTVLFPISAATYALMIVWLTGPAVRPSRGSPSGSISFARQPITGSITAIRPFIIVWLTDGRTMCAIASPSGAPWSA